MGNDSFNYSKMTPTRKQAINNIRETAKNSEPISNFGEYDCSVFENTTLKDWQANAKTNSVFGEISKLGTDDVFSIMDANGDGVVSKAEAQGFADVMHISTGSPEVSNGKFNASDLDGLKNYSILNADDAPAPVVKTVSTGSGDIDTSKVKDVDKDKGNIDNKDGKDGKGSGSDDSLTVNLNQKGLPKDAYNRGRVSLDKDGNYTVKVEKWLGSDDKKYGDRDDDLYRIVKNSYKDANLSDKQVLDLCAEIGRINNIKNIRIVQPGQVIKLPALKLDKNGKFNGQYYTADEVKNHLKSKTQGGEGDDIEDTSSPIKETTFDPGTHAPNGTSETTVKDGVTTVVNKDLSGNPTGSKTISKESDNTVTTSFDASGNKKSVYSEDKNGRPTLYQEFGTDGQLKESTKIIWDGSSSDAKRTVIETKDGGNTYTKYEIAEGSGTRGDGKPCKADGTLIDKTADTKKETVYNPVTNEAIGTKETTIDGDITTVVSYDKSGKKTSTSKTDKNGRPTYFEEYSTDGKLKDSMQIIWDSSDSSANAKRTVIETKDGGNTYTKYKIAKDSNTRDKGILCDVNGDVGSDTQKAYDDFASGSALVAKDGDIARYIDMMNSYGKDSKVSNKDKKDYYNEKLKSISDLLKNASTDEIQGVVAGMSDSQIKELFSVMNKTDGDAAKSLANKLFTPDLKYVDNIAKMTDLYVKSGSIDKYNYDEYNRIEYQRSIHTLLDSQKDFNSLSQTDKETLLATFANYYGADDKDWQVVTKLITPVSHDVDAIKDSQSLMDSFMKKMLEVKPNDTAVLLDSVYKPAQRDLVKSFSVEDYKKIIQSEGSNAEKFIMQACGIDPTYGDIHQIPNYKVYNDAQYEITHPKKK